MRAGGGGLNLCWLLGQHAGGTVARTVCRRWPHLAVAVALAAADRQHTSC